MPKDKTELPKDFRVRVAKALITALAYTQQCTDEEFMNYVAANDDNGQDELRIVWTDFEIVMFGSK